MKSFFRFHPVASVIAIIAAYTVIPGAIVVLSTALFGDSPALNKLLLIYSLIIELLLCLFADRFFLAVLPFVISVLGVLGCEGVYLAAQVAVQSGGSGKAAFAATSYGVILFGAEFVGVAFGLIAYAIVALIKRFRE